MENIELYKVFTIVKGNRERRWKVIPHLYFDDAYALVTDHIYLRSGKEFLKADESHTVAGCRELSKMYQMAYDHT